MKFKNASKATALLSAVCALGCTATTFAGTMTASKEVVKVEEPATSPFAVTFDLGYDSAYIFRGVNVLDGATSGGNLGWGQIALSGYGFTAGAWYAQSLNEGNASLSYNELDLFLSYSHSFGPVDLSAGYTYYLYPKRNDLFSTRNQSSHEFNVGVSTSVVPFVTPSLTFYYDVDLFDGGYLEFKLASSIPVIADKLSIDPYALISYDFKYNSNTDDWNNFQAGVSIPYHVTKNFTVSGYAAVTVALDAIQSFSDDYEVFGGGKVSFSF